jgi:hypothetical protein
MPFTRTLDGQRYNETRSEYSPGNGEMNLHEVDTNSFTAAELSQLSRPLGNAMVPVETPTSTSVESTTSTGRGKRLKVEVIG